jgi:hypothetical protein
MTMNEVQRLTPEEVEAVFQGALSSNDWDTVYYCIDFACHNQCKKLLKGIRMPPERFEIRVGEAVLECIEKIKIRGDRPLKLSAYTYWPCKRALWSKSAIEEDKEMLSYEADFTDNILNREEKGEIFYEQ